MAVSQVSPVQKRQMVKTKEGGAKTGQILGALAGAGLAAGAAAATGGVGIAAAPAIMGAAGTGAGLGSLIGGKVAPATQQVTQAPAGATQMQAPKLSANGQQLQQSLAALKQFDQGFQEQVSFPLVAALMHDIKQNNPGMGGQPQQPQGLGQLA